MQIVTLEEIQKKFESLPEDLKWAIMAANVDDKIIEIGQKHGLLVEKMEQLSLETHAVMFGYTHPDKFEESVKASLGLPELKVKEIVEDVNEKILKDIRDKYMSLYDKPRETFKITEPAEPNPNVIPVETHTSSPNVINIKESPVLSKSTDIEVMPEELGAGGKKLRITNDELQIKDKEIFSEKFVEKPVQKIEKLIPNAAPIKNIVPPVVAPTPNTAKPANSIFTQKLSGSFQLPTIKTEYSLPSLGKDKVAPSVSSKTVGSKDPYREIPE